MISFHVFWVNCFLQFPLIPINRAVKILYSFNLLHLNFLNCNAIFFIKNKFMCENLFSSKFSPNLTTTGWLMSRCFREFFFNTTQIASLSFNFTCEFLMNHKNPISCVYFLLAFVSSQLHCCSISFRLRCRSLWNLPFSRKRLIRDKNNNNKNVLSFFSTSCGCFFFSWTQVNSEKPNQLDIFVPQKLLSSCGFLLFLVSM